MAQVVTLGEAMIRLSPPDFHRFEQANSFDVKVGGGELNVAVGVSRLGLESAWVSKLPDNALGRLVRNKAREQGVDTSNVVWSESGRVGIYFLEFGASPRASSVLYDRANSAVSTLEPGEVDWEKALRGCSIFHVSGITPALSKSCAGATFEAIRAAKEAGAKVSFDVNYRKKLWTPEEANACLVPMMEYVDILITTEEDTGIVFGIREKTYQEVAVKLEEQFGFEVVAITLREDLSVLRNNWSAFAYAAKQFHESAKYSCELIDRIGAGDSFTAGFIYGYLTGDVQKGVDYGAAYSALKHSIPGDLNWATLEEVEAQLKGAGTRIQR
ncbi:MAG TPA: sugar kinase [Armatimonadota bacterium]|nr:sugar kinase [Armatimonadota bacterium]